MSKANGKCNRCQGSGFRDTPVAHLGVPGLCYGCNGDGSYKTFAANVAATKARKIATAKETAALGKVWATRETNRRDRMSRELRVWARSSGTFTTKDFAEAHGMECKEAWIVLCCSYPAVGPAFNDQSEAIGWTAY
jgi:hypothetical protein